MAEIIKTVDESLAHSYIFGAVSADAPNVLQKNFRTPGGTEYVGRGETRFPTRNIYAMLVKPIEPYNADVKISIQASCRSSKQIFLFDVLVGNDSGVGAIKRFFPKDLFHDDIVDIVDVKSSGWQAGMVVIFCEDQGLLNDEFDAYYNNWCKKNSGRVRDLLLVELFKKIVAPKISDYDYNLRALTRAISDLKWMD